MRLITAAATAATALLATLATAPTTSAAQAAATATTADCGVHPQGYSGDYYSGFSNRWKEGQYGTIDGQIYVCRNGQLVKF